MRVLMFSFIARRVHCTTYQIPLICKVRVGGIFVLFGRADDVLDGDRRQLSVAALLAPEAHLLYHAVDLKHTQSAPSDIYETARVLGQRVM